MWANSTCKLPFELALTTGLTLEEYVLFSQSSQIFETTSVVQNPKLPAELKTLNRLLFPIQAKLTNPGIRKNHEVK